ncbi:hypothetical protein DFH06DRAFT_175923 [Mycena polygramma]|nr:hypothetical protein DFH06DRAFT_175923 [Mycena polygramma]
MRRPVSHTSSTGFTIVHPLPSPSCWSASLLHLHLHLHLHLVLPFFVPAPPRTFYPAPPGAESGSDKTRDERELRGRMRSRYPHRARTPRYGWRRRRNGARPRSAVPHNPRGTARDRAAHDGMTEGDGWLGGDRERTPTLACRYDIVSRHCGPTGRRVYAHPNAIPGIIRSPPPSFLPPLTLRAHRAPMARSSSASVATKKTRASGPSGSAISHRQRSCSRYRSWSRRRRDHRQCGGKDVWVRRQGTDKDAPRRIMRHPQLDDPVVEQHCQQARRAREPSCTHPPRDPRHSSSLSCFVSLNLTRRAPRPSFLPILLFDAVLDTYHPRKNDISRQRQEDSCIRPSVAIFDSAAPAAPARDSGAGECGEGQRRSPSAACGTRIRHDGGYASTKRRHTGMIPPAPRAPSSGAIAVDSDAPLPGRQTLG